MGKLKIILGLTITCSALYLLNSWYTFAFYGLVIMVVGIFIIYVLEYLICERKNFTSLEDFLDKKSSAAYEKANKIIEGVDKNEKI